MYQSKKPRLKTREERLKIQAEAERDGCQDAYTNRYGMPCSLVFVAALLIAGLTIKRRTSRSV